MPGHDDTLNAGGPEGDAMDELCTCGHTLGVHHTLDEACCEDGCECCAFQRVNAEFGNGQPSEEQLQAQLDAHNDRRASEIGESVRELTADLPGGEGRIGEIKDELDQILDAALLCTDSNCRHRRDRHKHDGCNDCDCPAFLEPKSTEEELLEVPGFLRADARATRNSNTDEAVDLWSNDARARAMDAEPLSPTESMTDEQRTESDAVQAETLDNLCTCGHRYGDHASNYGELCLLADCECVKFEALLKPADLEFVHDSPVDPEAIRRATRGPADEEVERVLGDNPFRFACCLKCGHSAEDHAALASHTVCHVEGCDCEALVEYTGAELDPKGITFAHDENIGPAPEDIVDEHGDHPYSAIDHEKLELDRRLPYTPPLLRKKYIGEAELRKVLIDAGRLDLLQQLPEVDRVTTNYDAEHWQEIERLARNPQGSSETARPESERTITAIATALLELRQCLGVTIDNARMLDIIQQNTVAIQETVKALDRIVGRVPGEDT